nr:dTDP-4-dehydrorhamnose reductase [Bacilli bacterium]
MRVLITGANGMLGTDLVQQLSAHTLIALTQDDLDITDHLATMTMVKEHRPEVIINAAAFTNVDLCEDAIDEAYRVNALGPRNLAIAASAVDASLVHISTDYVFAGDDPQARREYDETRPVSIYGKSKLAGEIAVRQHNTNHFIVRTAWLYGFAGNNFVTTMLRLARERGEVSVVDDQIGSPTYTVDLAKAIAHLLGTNAYGTYHLSNAGVCSWFEFAKAIFALSKLDVNVNPITSDQLTRKAKRPSYSVLDNQMWRLQGFAALRDYQEALADYLFLLQNQKEVNV